MLSRIAERITDTLVESGNIASENREVYRYGFETGIAQVINLITTLVIGLLFKMPLESLFFLLSFMTLRTYTGGYHSSNHLICYIISVTMTVAVLLAGKNIIIHGLNYLGVGLCIIGICLLIWLAPVEDRNKPMDEIEKVVFRKRAMRNLLLWTAATAGLFFTSFRNISVVLCLCLFAMGIVTVCGLWKNHILDKRAK